MKPPIDYVDETPPPEPDRRVLAVALILGALFGFIAGYALGDVPEHVPGPGFDVCKTRGC